MFFFLSFFFFFNLIYCRRGKPEFSFLFFLSLLDENDVGRGKCIVVDRNFRIEMKAFFRVIFFFCNFYIKGLLYMYRRVFLECISV